MHQLVDQDLQAEDRVRLLVHWMAGLRSGYPIVLRILSTHQRLDAFVDDHQFDGAVFIKRLGHRQRLRKSYLARTYLTTTINTTIGERANPR